MYKNQWDNHELREIIIENWHTNVWKKIKQWAKSNRPEEYKIAEDKAKEYNISEEDKISNDKKDIKQLDNENVPKIYRIPFNSFKIKVKKNLIKKLIEFCYGIDVKNTRSGGSEIRNQEKKRYDNLQGKMAEIIIYSLYKDIYNFEDIDFDLYERGEWDSLDLISKLSKLNINVKSGLHFHNLLLLTAKDYDEYGNYKHHINEDNCKQIFSFVRVKLDKDKLIKMLSKNINEFYKWFLKEYETIEYDLFFCNIKTVKNAISKGNLIKKDEKLNGTEKMDADNYYLLIYNMYKTINEVI